MRCARLSDEKPAKITEWTAPMRAQASMAMGSSQTVGRYRDTASPLLTPSDLSQLACVEVR